MIRYIQRFASFAATAIGVRLYPGAVPFGYDNTDNQMKFMDANSVIRTFLAAAAPLVTNAVTYTITAADRGRMIIATLGSGTQTFTLPLAASNPGHEVTLVCGDAAGEILLNPNAADQISMKGLVDQSTSVKPAAGTGVKNTAATNVLGDFKTFKSDGVATWHQTAGAGIWASQ